MFVRLVGRFARDESGVFAVLFGVMAVVLVAMAGAVVDYVQVDQVRNRSQIALDAASLALQPEIYSKTKAQIEVTAQTLLIERIGDPNVTATINAVDVDTENGQLLLRAELSVPLNFVSLLGISQMTTQIVSQVTRKKLKIEVAFVLDNSGSMSSSSRMTNLKSAANCATNILFYGDCVPAAGATKSPDTKISVVPFNFFVNVGSSNSGASWIDGSGVSTIANDNFDDDSVDDTAFTGAVNRLSLFSGISGVSWAGCVEARPYPYSVNDTTPDASVPDTLFVPEFAPDEPDTGGYSNNYLDDLGGACITPKFVWTQTRSRCNDNVDWSWNKEWTYNNTYCSGGTSNSYQITYADGSTSTSVTAPPASIDGQTTQRLYESYSGASVSGGKYDNTRSRTYYYISDRERQERLCKYSGASVGALASDKGPNAGCPVTSILPLSDNVSTITGRISSMVADGATNIHQGVIWGFRALSPSAPFTEGRAYGTATSKVMIVMTDGENTYYSSNNMNGTSYYSPYGYLWNGRVGTYGSDNASSMQTKTDTLTLEACSNAKAAGITIYTIGLNPPNTATRTMLTSCASEAGMAYFPAQPSELNDVFTAIAEQLSKLRIEK